MVKINALYSCWCIAYHIVKVPKANVMVVRPNCHSLKCWINFQHETACCVRYYRRNFTQIAVYIEIPNGNCSSVSLVSSSSGYYIIRIRWPCGFIHLYTISIKIYIILLWITSKMLWRDKNKWIQKCEFVTSQLDFARFSGFMVRISRTDKKSTCWIHSM